MLGVPPVCGKTEDDEDEAAGVREDRGRRGGGPRVCGEAEEDKEEARRCAGKLRRDDRLRGEARSRRSQTLTLGERL